MTGVQTCALPISPPLFGLLNKNRNEANFSTERERINRAVNWLQVEFPSRAHEFTTDPDPRIAGWIEADMRAMAQELRSHDIEFIFQNYPPLRTGKQRPENLIINALCEREKFPWTDIERYFREMPDLSHLYSDEFGNLDNHLNAEGYKRLASKLIIEMKKKSLLNFKEKALNP